MRPLKLVCWMARHRPVTYRSLTGCLFGPLRRHQIKWEIIIAVLHVCLLHAIVCQKLQMTLKSRENDGQRHSRQCNAVMHPHTTGTSSECARRIACIVSMRHVTKSITGDTFWKPVTGWKPVNRLTDYHFNKPSWDSLMLAAACRARWRWADFVQAMTSGVIWLITI